ncbi:MAG TPA: lipopolysaccharide heptosyltransferase II [Chloroflexota bacterium]|nr:lipopolysaccharide heptosyltransferase II [Chloroflexota bacterium]
MSGGLWAHARRAADAAAWGVFGGLGLATRLAGGRVAPPEPARVRRILVIRLDLLGDLVFAAPALAALRAAYPAAELTLLTLPYTRPLATLIPGVDRTLALDVNRYRRPAGWRHLGEVLALVRQLRTARFDLCLALHGRPAGALALLSGARYRVGYAAHAYPFAFNLPAPGRRYERRQHEVEYCLDLARRVGANGPPVPRLTAPATDYRVPGLAPGERYLVLHPGASNGSAKRWPATAWGQLAHAAARELGLRVVLSGGAGERALVAAVAAGARASAVPLVGTSLLELAALLAGAEAVVSGDTGPLHVAAALGRPVLGIYGPTDPVQTGPLGARAAVVRRPVPCGPCYDLRAPAECKLPDGAHVCMRELQPDTVLAALLDLLRPADGTRLSLARPASKGGG